LTRKKRRKKTLEQKQSEMKIDPLSIPLPDLGNPEKSNTDKEENKVVEKTEIKQEKEEYDLLPRLVRSREYVRERLLDVV
jgi:hypothetical protein